ncbi:thioredoxin 1 [Breznakia sp. PF5-3]|uniref:thioredoxin family protein n=1 Tax=unclassified Breznakia TaxID=2623764 RepID=UPI00240574F2|nr:MULTISPECIES: thioredoxin family protein [unclassified Breznakia]MDL2276880.1 thioredoxin family protein [Breznakia sp. OttesenSCG-928-G09]MDF9823777.1 thioredoxin 1 [Breznakia sp. PM6-1]MDF9834657.1 thioredoxin 1 [Breznakia sp. PF5-3]MDF9836726.1 thioredoxin 1 [Breznakia sp. PFB2-8]MDF9858825.1 thioredoxin 1 [Breznakia sp. PH5-24]
MLKNENFKEVLENEEFCLVLVSGDGCANCTTMTPIVNQMRDKFDELSVYVVDINQSNHKITEFYEIEVVPTILLLHRGHVISKVTGYQPEEILEIYIDCKIGEYKQRKVYAN